MQGFVTLRRKFTLESLTNLHRKTKLDLYKPDQIKNHQPHMKNPVLKIEK